MDQLLKEYDGHGYDSVPSEPELPRFCVELANLISLSKQVEKSTINLQSTLNLANFEDLVNVEALGKKSFCFVFVLFFFFVFCSSSLPFCRAEGGGDPGHRAPYQRDCDG
jgi:hypothetical protein